MNILGLAFFTLQILLETYIFPNYPSEYLSSKLFNFLGFLLTLYLSRSDLRKHSFHMIFLVLIANALLRKYLFSYYYPTRPQLDMVFELTISFAFALSFVFASQKDFDEIEESKIFPDLRKFICSFLFANGSAFYYEHYTFNGVNQNADLNFKFLGENIERIFADFAILNGIFVICEMLNYSAKRDNARLKSIFRYFMLNLIFTVVYFAIFNANISSLIYDLLFSYVSKPYNIILYNMFAYPAVIKFKIAFAAIFYLF